MLAFFSHNITNGFYSISRFKSYVLPHHGICSTEEEEFVKLGVFTALLAPITIYNPHYSLYPYVNILTALLYSLLNFVTLTLVSLWDEYLPNDLEKEAVIIANLVLILALGISVGVSYFIMHLVYSQNKSKLFYFACDSNDWEKVDLFLKDTTIDHNVTDKAGRSILFRALAKEDETLTKKLLDCENIDISMQLKIKDPTKDPLEIASIFNNEEVVNRLLETKRYQHLPNVLKKALKIAYEKNSWKIVPLLLDNSDLSDWTDWTHKFLAEGPCNKLWEQAFEKLAKADGEDNGKIEVKSLVEWIKSLELNSEDEYFLDISPIQIERIVNKVKVS